MNTEDILTPAAVEALADAGLTPEGWRQRHYPTSGWGGDACGCTDDRCIGHHHDADEDCGCLPELLKDAQAAA